MCNQSEPLADASGRIVDLVNENGSTVDQATTNNNKGLHQCQQPFVVNSTPRRKQKAAIDYGGLLDIDAGF